MKTACPCVEDLVQVIRINASFSLDELLSSGSHKTHICACGKPSLAHMNRRRTGSTTGQAVRQLRFAISDIMMSRVALQGVLSCV